MALNDLISDVLTRVRNGQRAGHEYVVTPCSNSIKGLLDVMVREGYIQGYESFEVRPGINNLKVDLKYSSGQPVIKELKRVSKPGRRVYTSVRLLPKVFSGLGISILSTPKGMLSDDEARMQKVGGEIICTVF